jgi:SOS-response transcriptional repressor LexA
MRQNPSCGGEPFALRVLGDSMLPEFKEGDIIVIEPDGVVRDGSYVLAMHQNEYIFRQIVIEDQRYYLKPLNDHYPTVEIPDLQAIHGVITQGGGIRRKDRKRYY